MEINLKVNCEKGFCDYDCPFLEVGLSHTGKAVCLLYKEPLTPEIKYGGVDKWNVCDSCRTVTNKMDFLGHTEKL